MTNTRHAPKMQKIKQDSLIKWFAAFSESAKAIDEVLIKNHTGDFEPLLYFHTWLKENDKYKSKRDENIVNLFGKSLGTIERHSKGKTYCSELIAFYDSIK